MEVPKHCIEIFTNKFKQYPSFIETKVSNLEKLISKSISFWSYQTIYDKKVEKENFLLYDSEGIMIYIKEGSPVIFLAKGDKIQNVELLISQLKRIK